MKIFLISLIVLSIILALVCVGGFIFTGDLLFFIYAFVNTVNACTLYLNLKTHIDLENIDV